MDKDFKVKKGLIVSDNIGIGTETPAVSIDAASRTDAIQFPVGNTAQRPSGANGMMRFNSTTGEFEGYSQSIGGWSQLSLAGSSIDADFLDSQPGSYYNDLTNATGTLAGARFTDSSHGTRAGGNLHAVANSTVNGFFANTDKAKLDTYPDVNNLMRVRAQLTTEDLNDVVVNGIYAQNTDGNATVGRNYPEVQGGTLVVRHDGYRVVQEYFTNSTTTNVWHRRYTGSAWTTWKRIWDNSNLQGSDVLSLIATVDGASSGLDADLLDGQQGSYYTNIPARLGYTPVNQSVVPADNTDFNTIITSGFYRLNTMTSAANRPTGYDPSWHQLIVSRGSDSIAQILMSYNTGMMWIRGGYGIGTTNTWTSWSLVWNSSNDGSGSGLDSDLLDGQEGSYYRNAGNLNAGTLPDARLSGAYTGLGSFAFGASLGSKLLLYNSDYGIGIDSGSLTYWSGGSHTWRIGGTSPSSGTVNLTLSSGSLALASGSMTIGGQTVWHAGNDGAGSGLDADLLDGQSSAYYTNIPARLGYTPWHSGNDGSGSGLDADLLDGQDSSYYTAITTRLGYTPVNRAGDSSITGVLETNNEVRSGSSSANSFRSIWGNKGTFWRFDGSNMYMMFTNDGDARGSFNSLRPFAADWASGNVSFGHSVSVTTALNVAGFPVGIQTEGAIGTYVYALYASSITAGTTVAGSSLSYASSTGAVGATLSGTWKAMGTQTGSNRTLYLRIS